MFGANQTSRGNGGCINLMGGRRYAQLTPLFMFNTIVKSEHNINLTHMYVCVYVYIFNTRTEIFQELGNSVTISK